jgi:hypothetical protein
MAFSITKPALSTFWQGKEREDEMRMGSVWNEFH